MSTCAYVVGLGLAASLAAGPALAAGTVVHFNGGIGVDPVGGLAAGAPVANSVRGVAPGGRPWVISRLKADVKDDGRISVSGEGLLFAGGDVIGTTGTIGEVAASLFCGATELDSSPAPLDADGQFTITGVLSGTLPNPCDSPILLIRNATGGTLGAWFAAGIPSD